jgi:hypothetical protein
MSLIIQFHQQKGSRYMSIFPLISLSTGVISSLRAKADDFSEPDILFVLVEV